MFRRITMGIMACTIAVATEAITGTSTAATMVGRITTVTRPP